MKKYLSFLVAFVVLGGFFIASADEAPRSKYSIFVDADQDGLSDAEEVSYGTDPAHGDTDNDGYRDGVEVESGYNPLVAAPGDRIETGRDALASVTSGSAEAATSALTDTNDTDTVGKKVADLIESNIAEGQELSMEELEEALREVMEISADDIVLPEISDADIKVKELKGEKNMTREEREARTREDTLEYLTSLSYLLATNAPSKFSTEEEMGSMAGGIISDVMTSLSSTNLEQVNQLADQGEALLPEIYAIEVPEAMVDFHKKALRIAQYCISLRDEIAVNADDPIGQMRVVAKGQAAMMIAMDLSVEIGVRMMDMGIENIPIEL